MGMVLWKVERKIRRKGVRRKWVDTDRASAIEWLEKGYDEWMSYRTERPAVIGEFGEAYRDSFAITMSSGLASLKADHETYSEHRGNCPWCESAKQLIVVE